MSKIVDTYKRLTPSERTFVAHHLKDAVQIRQDAASALKEAAVRYPGKGLHNGTGDAFRHAYWSALMTKHCGELVARRYGFAHEAVPPGDGKAAVVMNQNPTLVAQRYSLTQPRNERAMDEHNNAVGRQLALSYPSATEAQLAAKVAEALDAGRLMLKP